MEQSNEQKVIIDLGKAIVNELELDPGVDTLSKWMAHYIAEKIILAEKSVGKKKETVEKECFNTILNLWEHRWSIRLLEDFEPLFDTIEKLNPNKPNPFFFTPKFLFDLEEEDKKTESKELQNHLDSALEVDKIARTIIFDLLNQAISEIEVDERIKSAISLINYPDTKIIRFISDYDKYLEGQKDDEETERKDQIEELEKRISHLEEFTSVRDVLLNKYKQELLKLKK